MTESVVLVLTNSDSGLYDFRGEVLAALLDAGCRVLVSVPDTGHMEPIRALGCECIPTRMERRGMNPFQDYALFRHYRRLIRRYRPRAVLTYTIKPNIYGGLAARISGTPYLANITGLGTTMEQDGPLRRLIECMYRVALKRASCVFFQNKGNREFMRQMGCVSGHDHILPGSGVNLDAHPAEDYPGGDGQVCFLSMMRIMKDKGAGELFAAAERIHARHPETVFWLLGAYEEETRAEYEPVVTRLEEQGALVYYGYRDDAPDFLKRCHAVVHPSYHEGMSNVLLEAAATARPVLASNVEGCIDTFEDGIGGYAFPPRDAEALEEAVERFLSLSHAERAAMGAAARRYVEEHFDRRLVVKAYLKELEGLI